MQLNATDWYNWFIWHIVFFFSVIATFFDIASCFFKLKCFNFSYFLIPFPFIKLGPWIVIKFGKSLIKIEKSCIPQIISLNNMNINEIIDFRFCISLITLHWYLRYLFFLFTSYISTFIYFLDSLQMINILREMKKFLVDLMTRLSYNMIYQLVHHPAYRMYNPSFSNKSCECVFPFDEFIMLFLGYLFSRNLYWSYSLFFIHCQVI